MLDFDSSVAITMARRLCQAMDWQITLVFFVAAGSVSACKTECPPNYVHRGSYCEKSQTQDAGADSGMRVLSESSSDGTKHTPDSSGGKSGEPIAGNASSVGSAGQGGAGDSPIGGNASPNAPLSGSGGTRAANSSSAVAGTSGSAAPSAVCGNNVREGSETCDGDCVMQCEASNACVPATMTGSAATCDVQCKTMEITQCKSGDGCCPMGCSHATDSDCSAKCGDGVLDVGEACEPKSTEKPCPTAADCDDSDPCTSDKLTGSAEQCSAQCAHSPITTATGGDGCCPKGANASNDSDCMTVCGDGVVTGSEKCDPKSSQPCPSDCNDDDACTTDHMTGSPAQCTATCTNTRITAPASGDGCCPAGANAENDSDCPTKCGDGVVTGNETCDPRSSTPCPTSCDDGDACTADKTSGSASACTAICAHTKLSASNSAADGCCPAGADASTDLDCPAVCGNGKTEPSEECDWRAPGEHVNFSCDNQCHRMNLLTSCSSDQECKGNPAGMCANGECVPYCSNPNNAPCAPLPGATKSMGYCAGSPLTYCIWNCSDAASSNDYCGSEATCVSGLCRLK